MNKVLLIGNVTRDLELKTTASGISVCAFDIAVKRRFKDESGEAQTDFFHVITWRGLAENCATYLHKGSKVAVGGSLQNRSYDAKDGSKRTVTEILADEVEFLTKADNASESGQGSAQTGQQPAPKKSVSELEPVDPDDLPF